MTPRQRFIETLTFGRPDRIPFEPGHGRESTLARWHAEGLPPGRAPVDAVRELLGIAPEVTMPRVNLGVDLRLIPQFEERVLEHTAGHYIVQDWKGNVCEISDQFDVTYLRIPRDFVTRRWLRCPVQSRADWEAMRERYRLDSPGRFPADFIERCRLAGRRDWVLTLPVNGPFWQMREWCGFEGLCMLMVDQPELVDEMAAFWTDFVAGMLERILPHVAPDVLHISEDMAYKAKPMISPEMTRRFCMPAWQRWADQCRRAGVPVVAMDSDGYVETLIPLWIESGIGACDPMEVAAGNDLPVMRERFGRSMAYRGGVDKRAIAKGGEAIRQELRRLEPAIRAGGYIPGCDHGVPADVSWPAFTDYCRLLAELTGWV